MTFSQGRSARGFADYLRYIRSAPGFEWRFLASACFFSATYLREGWRTALAAAGAGLFIVFPLGFLWWRRPGSRRPQRPSPVASGLGARRRRGVHPWLLRVAGFAIALSSLLAMGLVGSAAGLAAGSYVALVAALVLLGVAAPLFVALVLLRSDKPRQTRRWRR